MAYSNIFWVLIQKIIVVLTRNQYLDVYQGTNLAKIPQILIICIAYGLRVQNHKIQMFDQNLPSKHLELNIWSAWVGTQLKQSI